MNDPVKARRLVAEIVADREEGTEDAWWHSNVSDFVLDESYGEHDGRNGADRRRILRVPAVERALIAALDLTGVEAMETENKRLRDAIFEATHPDFIFGAMDNVSDMDVSITDFAEAASRAIRAAVKEADNG